MTTRLRIGFSKLGKIRFTSHRDVARMWERGFRRARLPVAYSEGFTPRPRVSFGLALSTGYESLGEYLDVELGEGAPMALDELAPVLDDCLPGGLAVIGVAELAPGTPSLQAGVTSCGWVIGVDGVARDEAVAAVGGALTAGELTASVRRKGNEVVADLRPGLHELAVVDGFPVTAGDAADPGAVAIAARLATQPLAVRPADLVAALFPRGTERRVVRTHQWIESDGARCEPLELPNATSSTRTPVVCA